MHRETTTSTIVRYDVLINTSDKKLLLCTDPDETEAEFNTHRRTAEGQVRGLVKGRTTQLGRGAEQQKLNTLKYSGGGFVFFWDRP